MSEDLRKRIFDLGLELLTAAEMPVRQARGFLGRCLKTHSELALVEALEAAERERPIDPAAWIRAALRSGPRKPRSRFVKGKPNRFQCRSGKVITVLPENRICFEKNPHVDGHQLPDGTWIVAEGGHWIGPANGPKRTDDEWKDSVPYSRESLELAGGIGRRIS